VSGPLAIVAGGGPLPWDAADAVRARREVVVIAIDGEADPPRPGVETRTFTFGQIGSAKSFAQDRGCRDVLMLGNVTKRPDFSAIGPDRDTLRLLPRILKAMVGGDDSIVRRVGALVGREGFRIVGVAEAVPELLAGEGVLGARAPHLVAAIGHLQAVFSKDLLGIPAT